MLNISSYLENYLVPEENYFSLDVDPPSLSNINLLMAAAISSPCTPEMDKYTIENETPKEPISVEKATEMWKNINEGEDEEQTCDSNKYLDSLNESGLSALDEINLYFKKLETFDIQQWSTDDTMNLLCVMTEFKDSEYLSHDFFAGNALFELLRLWKPTSSTSADLLCALCESKQIEMKHLIICLVSYPGRLSDFDSFFGEILYQLYHRKPEVWNEEWIAQLLGNLEADVECCDVDAVDVLFSFGQQLKDPAKLGKLAHSYLLATGLQNSFECRCKTAECLCPVEVDEGVAFIMFDGLVRKLGWSIGEKKIFFCKAVEKLFGPNVLTELGESLGIKNAADMCNWFEEVRTDESNCAALNTKCPGSGCSNMAKRDCVNTLCGRCCKRSGLWCDVHVDLFPTRYQTVRAHDLVKPRVHLARKEDLEGFLETKEEAQTVCFGSQFAVTDSDVIKVIDLCKHLVVLELGSSDSGCGGAITDVLLDHIVQNCPRLRKLRLESAHSVSDDAVVKVMKHCSELEFLEVSGNDRITGRVTDRSLKALFDRNILPKLKELVLTDQYDISYDVVTRLRRCRSNVEITAGHTDSDSMAWSLILGMTGRCYGDGLF